MQCFLFICFVCVCERACLCVLHHGDCVYGSLWSELNKFMSDSFILFNLIHAILASMVNKQERLPGQTAIK